MLISMCCVVGCVSEEEEKEQELKIIERLKCDVEFDFETGFFGPGWDPVTKSIINPSSNYVISSTIALPKNDATLEEEFQALNGSMIPWLENNEGVIATNLAGSNSCRTARTLTIWRDREAMMDFVTSPEHVKAVMRSLFVLDQGITTSWESDKIPTWAEARRKLDIKAGIEP